MAFGRAKSFFKRFRGTDADGNQFYDQAGYRAVWSRKELPSPGAMNFAYESLALSPESPISGAVAQRSQIRPTTPNTQRQMLTTTLDGIPLVSGQVYGQPLYDPQSGYVAGAPLGAAPLVGLNIPAADPRPIPTNSPFPENQRAQ